MSLCSRTGGSIRASRSRDLSSVRARDCQSIRPLPRRGAPATAGSRGGECL
jgi:hypothetical protein